MEMNVSARKFRATHEEKDEKDLHKAHSIKHFSEMRSSLSILRKYLVGKRYIVSSFRYKNLAVYCDGSFTFVYGLADRNGYAEYTKSVEITCSPHLPEDAEITSMSSTNDGSLIALCGANGVFIVRVSTDLWASKSNYVPLDQYVCELEPVHPTLFESVRSPKVVQVRWIMADSFNCSMHYLAVLFDDNRIRIYQAENVYDVPSIVIDYSLYMCASDRPYEAPGSNSYGFFKSIVSFDCVTMRESNPVLFAIDSEGELFSTTVNVIGNVQPTTRPLVPPSALPCDPVGIQVVEHPAGEIFTVLAVLSSSNVVSFVVAVPDESSVHNLFLHEQIQLATKPRLNLCSTQLDSTVIVANNSLVLHLDLSEWIHEYAMLLQDQSGASTCSASTQVRELVNVTPNTETKSILCSWGPNHAVQLICKSGSTRGPTTVVIACTQDPPLTTVFMKTRDTTSSYAKSQTLSVPVVARSPLNEDALRAIIAKKEPLPQLTTGKSTREYLESVANFFNIAHKNQLIMAAALELSHDRLADLTKFAKQLTEKQNDVNQRLLKVLRQNVSLKDKKEKVRSDMTKSLLRADRVIARSFDRKLSGEETKLLATVKECRARMLGYAMETSKLSLQAAELQRETRGPARPFTASIGASIFVLQHGQEELLALKRRLESLSARIGTSLCDVEENKENIDSRH
ncbi:unnamed protein product [Cylicocyclus nassatus]|uniref:Nuclear pore complex protein Nup88 n=1 Tax=Cylicocyclus nassatus TaxID=53992 RepID=A0AA36MCL4_CYLNA|nr:unnamed protein product [Cylicocyclus nassatus]